MRARNRLALVASGTLCLLVSVYVTATRQGAVEARVRELLAGTLRAPCVFDEAEFTFLDGLTVSGLRVLDPEDPLRAPLVEVGRARLDFNLDLLGRGPHLTVVHLQQPTVRVSADRDGRLSLLSIVAPPEEGAPPVRLPVFRIVDGRVVLDGPPALPPGDTAELTSIRADVLAGDGVLRVPQGHARSTGLGALSFSLDVVDDQRALRATVQLDELDVAAFRDHGRVASVTEILRRHDVTGTAAAEATVELLDGVVTRLDVDARLAGAAVTLALPEHEGLPPTEPLTVELERLHATLRDGRLTVEDGAGRALGAPLEVSGVADVGRVLGFGADVPPTVDLTVAVWGARVGPDVHPHFPRHLRRIGEAFTLAGVADARLHLRGQLEEPDVDAHLDVRGASASYAGYDDPDTGERRGFPWTAEELDGTVDVVGRRVEFRARGRHGSAGVEVVGSTEGTDDGDRTEVHVAVTDLPIDDDLHAAFGDRAEPTLGPWRPTGTAGRVEVLVEQIPGVGGGETGTHVTLHLDGRAAFTPHLLPVPLRDVRGVVRILEPAVADRRVSRVEIETLRAAGDGFAVAAGDGYVQGETEDFRLRFDVDRVGGAFTEGVLGSSTLNDGTKRAVRLLRPAGSLDLDVLVRATDGVRDDVVTATLRGVEVAGWEGVPLPVRALEGVVRYEDDALHTAGVDGAVLGGAVVHVAGSLSALSEPEPWPRLEIAARDLPLDSRLRDALGTLAEPARAVWDETPPASDMRGDVAATIRPPDDPDGELELRITDLHGGVRVLGLEMDVQSGDVAYAGGAVTGAFVAGRGAGEVRVDDLRYTTADGRVTARVVARGLAFPDDLVPLLPEESAAAVAATLGPARLHLPGLGLDWDAGARRLTASGAAALRVTVEGQRLPGLHVRAALEELRAVAAFPEGGPVTLDGTARLRETSLDPGVALTELSGDVAFRGALGATPSTFEADLTNGSGRLLGLLLESLAVRLETEGERLRLPTVTASVYGGTLTGRFNRGGDRMAYRGAAEAKGVDLARYAADAQRDPMSGTLDVELRFRNPGGAAGELEGGGSAEVSGAEIRVPWISATLRAVDRALFGVAAIQGSFHAGSVAFDLRGRNLLVQELFFEGPSVPLLLGARLELQEGRGAIDLVDGRIDMVVYPRLRLGVLGLDPTGIFDRIVGLAQFMVRRLRIEGTTRNPRTTWEVIAGDLDDELKPRPRPIGEVRRYGPEPW